MVSASAYAGASALALRTMKKGFLSTDKPELARPRKPNVKRYSLPDAVAKIFHEVASRGGGPEVQTEAGTFVGDAPKRPGNAGGPQIRTAEDWQTLLNEISAAGLLPMNELLEVSRGLALPASLKSLQQRIDNAHMPKGAKEIDGHFEDSVNRVRHLHSLVLGEWNLPDMSQDQTLRAPRAD